MRRAIHPPFAWIIMRNLPEFPGAFVARLVTDPPTPYILLGHTLAEVQVQLGVSTRFAQNRTLGRKVNRIRGL
jgi:hypothetical protein